MPFLFASTAAGQDSFRDKLVLDPDETCSTGVPAAGDIIALALRGAKGKNYVRAGNQDVPRLAVRGAVTDEYSIFRFVQAATEDTVALFSFGHEQFVLMDEETRLFAQAEGKAALLMSLEDTGDGYFRIKLDGYPFWMGMNANGYLDFRARSTDNAVTFCAQLIAAE
ncbi:hypothetical protein [Aquisalinus flavus]|uniref:Uncharacterized protein n=1 Tax=Aquisalinus flavus TaxID=1526572 RepID=A0A8J2V6Z7_9PROT|nr:hypothetical protein [Aquisalinus flavus]MBD0425950.1 hypothetical protein [Aquisalinus flavus]UNE48457.1 hypothetical protein FF099_10555 [Aquisalinus flavus]GGD11932.1 hypothetical protein GCM10011342_20930 [Aquisalinus flavus]